jgi:TonB family protein
MFPAVALSFFLSWVQVSSDTYVVKSSAGEERAKRVLKELEGFHQLVGTLVFRSTELPELPIEVLLIGDDQTMKELAPDYNGRKVAVAGYYQRGQDRDFIVLSGRVFPETLTSVVYHELTHYFLSRALVQRPAWLNEGLAEYFATADIREDEISLGALSVERLQLLKTNAPLPLKTFFAVDSNSPYYNESFKANVFYAQAWAFVYFMMHGEYAGRFKRYVEAMTQGEAKLLDYLNVGERDLEIAFLNFLKVFMPYSVRTHTKVAGETWTMKVESIPETEAQISIAEIFFASGKFAAARHHLEAVAARDPEFLRASYYRGMLARIAGENNARDFFVDALPDPHLGARAAVQLVQMGELYIPAVRGLLEQAAAAGTRTSDVYWALAQIYSDDVRRIEEAVRLNARRSAPPVQSPKPAPPQVLEPVWQRYAEGSEFNVRYSLLSESQSQPQIQTFVPPYYPADLLDQKLAGEVVIDVQVTEDGRVAGIWLVSAAPDVFANLATAAVRKWQFDPFRAKIRIVLEFKP